MTRQFTELEVTQKVQELEKVTCDWCGGDIALGKDEILHLERAYSVTVTSVYFHQNVGISVWGIDDLCVDCVKKLRTLIQDAGIKVSNLDY